MRLVDFKVRIKKVAFYFLFLALVFSFGFFVWQNRQAYLTSYDSSYWQARYENSQWVKGFEAEELMGDAELYAWAGWRQIHGVDPTEISPEVPPFGKYLLGLTILLFGNQNIFGLLFGIATLCLLYLLAQLVIKDRVIALLVTTIFSLEPLFRENLATAMLDLPHLFFIMGSFYLLLKGLENRRWFVLMIVFLALATSIKMYLVGLGVTGLVFLYLLLAKRWKDLAFVVLLAPLFCLVYGLTYTLYFINSHSLLDFKYLHFWIRHFAKVKVENYPLGQILNILFRGRWLTWWDNGGVVKVAQWSIFWPILGINFFLMALKWLQTRDERLLAVVFWVGGYLAFLTTGVVYPRYLLVALPGLYILGGYTAKCLIENFLCAG